MDKNLEAAQKRARQYWFADGLAEFSGGMTMILLAIYFAIVQLFPDSSLVTVILFFGVFALAFGVRWVMQRIRLRTTYPRTGYVSPKSGWEDRKLLVIAIIFTLVLLATMFYLVLQVRNAIEVMTVIGGAIMTFIFAMAGYETRLVRLIYLAIFCFLLGLVLAYSGMGNYWGMAVLALAVSIILFIYGSITRLTYLRQINNLTENPDER